MSWAYYESYYLNKKNMKDDEKFEYSNDAKQIIEQKFDWTYFHY